jgi:hypothetical protein
MGAGVDVCASDQTQDDSKEYSVMPTHLYLHVGAGVPVPLHICTDDIHGVPSHYIKDTLAQDYLEGKGRRIRAVSSDYATGSSCTTSTV